MTLRRVVGACALVFAVAGSRVAAADECASNGIRADVDAPTRGMKAPANVRPRLSMSPSCGAPEGGPDPALRLVGPGDQVIEGLARASWREWFVELVAASPLAAGPWRLEIRRPQVVAIGRCDAGTCAPDRVELGPWEALAGFVVDGAWTDREAPGLHGLRSGRARATVGSVMISPCEAESAWVIETRLTFETARDPGTDPDAILYVLERRAAGSDQPFTALRIFRPDDAGRGRSSFTFTEEWGWGECWEYRLVARDLAGNETIGARTLEVTAPARPRRPAPGARR